MDAAAPDQLRFLGQLGLFTEFSRLLGGCDLRLPCLMEKLMGGFELTNIACRSGLLDKTLSDGVVWIEGGELLLELQILVGHLSQLLRQLLERHIRLSNDAEQGQSRVLGDAELLAQVGNSISKRTDGSRHGRIDQFLHSLRRDTANVRDGAVTDVAADGIPAAGDFHRSTADQLRRCRLCDENNRDR